MKEFGKDFEQDLKINKYKLDDECERHSSLYFYYADLLADAKTEKDEEEGKLKFMQAEEEMDLRKNPPLDKETGKLLKVTDAVAKAYLGSHPKIRKQQEKLNKVKEDIYHLEATVNSVEHRRSKLNNLVQLYQSGYFSKPDGYKKDNKNDSMQKDLRKNLGKRREKNNE